MWLSLSCFSVDNVGTGQVPKTANYLAFRSLQCSERAVHLFLKEALQVEVPFPIMWGIEDMCPFLSPTLPPQPPPLLTHTHVRRPDPQGTWVPRSCCLGWSPDFLEGNVQCRT